MRFVFTVICLACVFLLGQEVRTVFYPSVIRSSQKNLLEGASWTLGKNGWSVGDEQKGSPFSASAPAYHVTCSKPISAYWQSSAHVVIGHTYLVGAWTRFSNARLLFWTFGHAADTGDIWQQRLYCFGGFNDELLPYLSETSRKNLLGDPNEWRLCYRIFTADKKLKFNNVLSVYMGIYMATGDMIFAHPFLIDITDTEDTSLAIEIAHSPKAVKSLQVIYTGNGDVVWEKAYATPVRDATEKAAGGIDFRQNMASKNMKGYNLFITYEDGSQKKLSAPCEGIFIVRD